MQADGTNSLAVDTGGFAIRNENNFGRALDEIQRDAGTYYVVGYTPAKDTFDGKYRAISVKVARPGVKVRARRGYLALEPATLLRPTSRRPVRHPTLRRGRPAEAGRRKHRRRESQRPPTQRRRRTSLIAIANAGVRARRRSSTAGVRDAPLTSGRILRSQKPGPPPPRLTQIRGSARQFGAELSAERGWAAYEKGDVETAARDLGEAAKATDARPWVVYALGLSQFALRRFADAAQAWERVRREVPEFEPIYFALADAYGLQREDGTALKVLREAERRWPADAEVANAIGVIQIRRGALDAAIESFERATTVAPADALGYFNLARAHQMRLLKSQRYDSQMQKWIGGDEDRRRAIANFQKYLQLGGPYERQAREALAPSAGVAAQRVARGVREIRGPEGV